MALAIGIVIGVILGFVGALRFHRKIMSDMSEALLRGAEDELRKKYPDMK